MWVIAKGHGAGRFGGDVLGWGVGEGAAPGWDVLGDTPPLGRKAVVRSIRWVCGTSRAMGRWDHG